MNKITKEERDKNRQESRSIAMDSLEKTRKELQSTIEIMKDAVKEDNKEDIKDLKYNIELMNQHALSAILASINNELEYIGDLLSVEFDIKHHITEKNNKIDIVKLELNDSLVTVLNMHNVVNADLNVLDKGGYAWTFYTVTGSKHISPIFKNEDDALNWLKSKGILD